MMRRLFHLRVWRPSVEEELDWEIRHHLEERMDELRSQGMSDAEAEREARRAFGDEALVRRSVRRIERGARLRERVSLLVQNLAGDVRYGLRSAAAAPTFAAGVVLTLALGIGANAALFGVADALLLRPLPYASPGELVQVERYRPGQAFGQNHVSPHFARAWLERQAVFTEQFAYAFTGSIVLETGGAPRAVTGRAVSHGFSRTLGVAPALGRALEPADTRPGAVPVVLVSHDFWRGELGGSDDVLAHDLVLNGVPHRVVGVMPRGFKFPHVSVTDLWLPLYDDDTVLGSAVPYVHLVGRPRDALPAAGAAAASLGNALLREARPDTDVTVGLARLEDFRLRSPELRTALRLLAGAAVLILLVAGVNMANLLLVRAASRTRELSLRLALGASRTRLVAQLTTEALVLALLSAGVAVLMAYGGLRITQTLMPDTLAFHAAHAIELERRTLLFTFALALGSGLLFGMLPALQALRLAAGGRRALVPGGGAEPRGAGTLRRALVTVEVATSVVLLLAAGLLISSLVRLARVPPGIDLDRLAVIQFTVSRAEMPDDDARATYLRTLRERLAAVPGVQAVTIAEGLPPRASFHFGVALQVEGEEPRREDMPELLPFSGVEPDWFGVTGARLLAGRAFDRSDTYASGNVIIDEHLAAFLWPGGGAVGQRFRVGESSPWLTVVGVMGDLRLMGPDERIGNFEILHPLIDYADLDFVAFAARTDGDPGRLLQPLRAALHEVNPRQVVHEIATAETLYRASIDMQRFLPAVITSLALVALLLSAVGIFGLLAWGVSRRRREIGVRMALGARHAHVQRMVIREAMLPTLLGAAIGTAAALAASGVIRAALYGVEPTDPRIITAVILTTVTAALAAAVLPARRAMRVDPATVLRE